VGKLSHCAEADVARKTAKLIVRIVVMISQAAPSHGRDGNHPTSVSITAARYLIPATIFEGLL